MINRRAFLSGVAASAAMSITGCKTTSTEKPSTPSARIEEGIGLGPEEANAPAMSDGRPAIRAILAEADGSPLDAERLRTLTARDLNNDPLPQAIVTAAGGRARVELNEREPIQLCM